MELLNGLQANLLSPPVLFFVLGIVAAVARSDLRFPEALYVSLTIYLLAAIGFKGGVAIAEAGLATVWLPTLAAVALGALIPLWSYPILRFVGRLKVVDAAAIAGHYGSVSAVTFIAATSFLQALGQSYEGHATAFLAAMEAPAIIVAILIAKTVLRGEDDATGTLGKVLHEALLGRSVFLLIGTMLAGFLCGERGMQAVSGLFTEPFQGVLALFLLELGVVAGRRLQDLREVGAFLAVFGIVMPLLHGAVGVLLGSAVGLSLGGTTLLAVLAASASYIAAPAAMRLSLPDANPTLYLSASLVITFPFNVTLGIPIYYAMARWWLGGG
ncbi:MAG: sodium-dependent bicarbonate transport family permease [Acidobacteria bacterium]|nr:MAG: sodium-dependent bicarbonate transport family permease [Acidobacteriota bacterium]REK11490.1 MAG: sodium-dependent bicarbonate transport family permease [Acidobacteriota bacterium]